MTKPQAPANTVATAKPSPFLTHLADAARRHGHTEAATAEMVAWCRRFILFHGKQHPQELGRTEIGAYLEHVAKTDKDALRTIASARAALEFLYGTFLQRALGKTEANDYDVKKLQNGRPWKERTYILRGQITVRLLGCPEFRSAPPRPSSARHRPVPARPLEHSPRALGLLERPARPTFATRTATKGDGPGSRRPRPHRPRLATTSRRPPGTRLRGRRRRSSSGGWSRRWGR